MYYILYLISCNIHQSVCMFCIVSQVYYFIYLFWLKINAKINSFHKTSTKCTQAKQIWYTLNLKPSEHTCDCTYTVWPWSHNSPVFLVTSKHPALLSLDVAGRMWWFLTGRGHSGAGWECDCWGVVVTVAPMGMNSPDNWLVCGMTFSVTIAWPFGALGRRGSIRCTTTFFGRTARPRRLQYRGRNFYWRETTDCFYQLCRQPVNDFKDTQPRNNANWHTLNYLIPSQLCKSHSVQIRTVN
jgi:hypothetical protein